MSTEKFNIILHEYPIEIQLSAKKRAIWYHRSEENKIPKHIRDKLVGYNGDYIYTFDEHGWVTDLQGEKLIRNSRTAGKPNMKRINGQAIWDGDVSRYERNDLKKFLTEYFVPNIKRQLPERFITSKYIHAEFIFFTHLKMSSQDIDNHAYPYVKAFLDSLQVAGTIPNDGAYAVRGAYSRYVNIPEDEKRRLEIKIHFCENNQSIE